MTPGRTFVCTSSAVRGLLSMHPMLNTFMLYFIYAFWCPTQFHNRWCSYRSVVTRCLALIMKQELIILTHTNECSSPFLWTLLLYCVVFRRSCFSFCHFSSCIVCPFLNYVFSLPHCYLQIILRGPGGSMS